jgi:soluble lytic murein transglycosylase-like protein
MPKGKGKAGAILPLVIGGGIVAAIVFSGEAQAMPSNKNAKAIAVALAEKYSKVFGVPASLVLAILQIESQFKFDAVNKTDRAMARGGAWGIGQITLATAKDIAQRFPKEAKQYFSTFNGTGESLLDPETNIAMSAFILSRSWKRYATKPKNWVVAAMAYHQGAGTMDDIVKKLGPSYTADQLKNSLAPNGKIYFSWLQKTVDDENSAARIAMNAEIDDKRFVYV